MKKIGIILLLTIFPCVAQAYSKYSYESYDNQNIKLDHAFTLEFKSQNAEGWRAVSQRFIDGIQIDEEYQLDENYATIWWQVKCADNDTEYTGRRVGNNLILQGRLNGKHLNREITIDENPFYYNPKLGLMSFAKSGKKEHDFWGIHNLVLVRYNLTAKNEGVEVIDVGGEPVEAVRIEWSVKHVPFFMFNRTYWYRTSDYMYVKQIEKKGVKRILIKEE